MEFKLLFNVQTWSLKYFTKYKHGVQIIIQFINMVYEIVPNLQTCKHIPQILHVNIEPENFLKIQTQVSKSFLHYKHKGRTMLQIINMEAEILCKMETWSLKYYAKCKHGARKHQTHTLPHASTHACVCVCVCVCVIVQSTWCPKYQICKRKTLLFFTNYKHGKQNTM